MTANSSWATVSGVPTTGAGVADPHATVRANSSPSRHLMCSTTRCRLGFVTHRGTKCNPQPYSSEMGDRNGEPIIAGVGAAEIVTRVADAFLTNVSRAIVNKDDEIRQCLVTLLCEGHLLIEDVPGVGKTMLAKALARSFDCTFRRIQFTPDLLPSDVTGVRAFNQKLS